MKRIFLIIIVLVLVFVIAFLIYKSRIEKETNPVIITVKKGDFVVLVSSTGELQAKNFEKILGPSGLRRVGIYSDTKILDMIPEGTIVDSGDYVASLDKSDVTNKLKNIENEIQEIDAKYVQTKLTAIMNIRSAKDELINLKYELEERKIELEQSIYETPATKRKAEINLEKIQRSLKQSKTNYKLKVKKAKAEIREVEAVLNQKKLMRDNLLDLLDEFEIRAPKSGMLIYYKNWRGKIKAGSSISPWNPIVATLPDLTTMVSKTYINEIDISKIKLNQKVDIGVDAFPKKKYTGEIIEIANIGEQLPKSNAKVFEVLIKINEVDSILRPAMTTGNKIITASYEDVYHVPLEVINNNDSLTYVFKKAGKIVKQIVIVGESNENEIIIEEGLKEGDEILLTIPDNADKLKFVGLELQKKLNETVKDGEIMSNDKDDKLTGDENNLVRDNKKVFKNAR